MNPPQSITRWDMYISYFWWGANCGPVALAAVLGVSLGDVRRLLGEFDGSLVPSQMQAAIERSGRKCRAIGAQYPSHGLAGVYKDGATVGHAIAVSGSKMLDTFSLDWRGGWRDFEGWKRANRRYRVRWGIEVER